MMSMPGDDDDDDCAAAAAAAVAAATSAAAAATSAAAADDYNGDDDYAAANEEVRSKIQQAIGPHEDLLMIVKRRKVQWYGHVSRSLGLARTILQGTVNGKDDKADGGRAGKTTAGNGQAWSSLSPRRPWRTGKMEETDC